MIGAAIDDAYIAELKKLVVHQDAIDQVKKIHLRLYTHRFMEPVISRSEES